MFFHEESGATRANIQKPTEDATDKLASSFELRPLRYGEWLVDSG